MPEPFLGTQLDERATAMALIGLIQGLMMQSLLSDKSAAAWQQAKTTFAIFRRGIEGDRR